MGLFRTHWLPFSTAKCGPDVGLHPGALLESEGTMDLFQTHTQRQVELEVAVVEHIAFLVPEVGDQLFDLGRGQPSAKEVVLVL